MKVKIGSRYKIVVDYPSSAQLVVGDIVELIKIESDCSYIVREVEVEVNFASNRTWYVRPHHLAPYALNKGEK